MIVERSDDGFDGPYRRSVAGGLVEFLGYDGRVEWYGRPRAGVVFPPDYETHPWWWKYFPLSVQIRANVQDLRMSLDEAARACAVPDEAALFVLGLSRQAQPVRFERPLKTGSDTRVSRRAART